MRNEEVIKHLKATRLFSLFDAADLSAFVAAGHVEHYQEGSPIIREGDVSPDFFVVIDGFVNVLVRDQDFDVFICTIGPGEIFGEAGLFAKVRRTASVKAAQAVTLLRLERSEFLKVVRERSTAGVKILMIIIYSLLSKLRGANQELAFERKFDIDQDDIDQIIRDIMP